MMMSFQDVIFFGNFTKLGLRRCFPTKCFDISRTNLTQQLQATTFELRMKIIITLSGKCGHAENLKSCLDGTRPLKYAYLK